MTVGWGGPDYRAVPGDYDGDGVTDIAVWHTPTGVWYLRFSSGGSIAIPFGGSSTDTPVPGDYNGDRVTDVAICRQNPGVPAFWYTRGVETPGVTPGSGAFGVWGVDDDVPVPADFDGDGRTDVAMWRPSTGEWWVHPHSTSPFVVWGILGDTPVPADFNGDGKIDPAVFRDSSATWWVPNVYTNRQVGASGDIPLPRRP